MKRAVLALIITALATPALAAAPSVVEGKFTEAYGRKNQPHRVYFVVTAGRGSKDCTVKLAGKTTQVSLGTDKTSDLEHIWYMHKRMAKRAVTQAHAGAPGRVLCNH